MFRHTIYGLKHHFIPAAHNTPPLSLTLPKMSSLIPPPTNIVHHAIIHLSHLSFLQSYPIHFYLLEVFSSQSSLFRIPQPQTFQDIIFIASSYPQHHQPYQSSLTISHISSSTLSSGSLKNLPRTLHLLTISFTSFKMILFILAMLESRTKISSEFVLASP